MENLESIRTMRSCRFALAMAPSRLDLADDDMAGVLARLWRRWHDRGEQSSVDGKST